MSAKDNITDECHIEYTGTQCMCALQSYAECESSEIETKVFISNTIGDQKAVENMVEDVVYFLGLITPSDECRSAAIQFFCLYFLGLCGTYNTDYRPTAAECREVRDSTCQSEWKEAERLLKLYGLSIELPKCSSLEDEGLDCDEGEFKMVLCYPVCMIPLLQQSALTTLLSYAMVLIQSTHPACWSVTSISTVTTTSASHDVTDSQSTLTNT